MRTGCLVKVASERCTAGLSMIQKQGRMFCVQLRDLIQTAFKGIRSGWYRMLIFVLETCAEKHNLIIHQSLQNCACFLQTEIQVLSRISHPNLVQLYGFCTEDGEGLLVFEYLPLGSLDYHLFGESVLSYAVSLLPSFLLTVVNVQVLLRMVRSILLGKNDCELLISLPYRSVSCMKRESFIETSRLQMFFWMQ